MLIATEATISKLAHVVEVTNIGTNIDLLRLMWAMMNGAFLKSRGSIHGALSESGFDAEEIRAIWSGFRYGSWEIGELLESWAEEVRYEGEWSAKKVGRYRVKGLDITGFWRPKLSGEVNKLYNSSAKRALPATICGITTTSGAIGEQRVPLLDAVIRCKVGTSEVEFRAELLEKTAKSLGVDEVVAVDAGFKVSEILAAKIVRFVGRGAVNCTARKNALPESKGRGRPLEYGVKVRPLPRTHKGNLIAATAAEVSGEFTHHGRTVKHESWHNLVTSTTKVATDNRTFAIYVFHDPLYDKPLVLMTAMDLTAEEIYLIYQERWPVEHPPLAAKQMIGLHRHFVFNEEACFRLPELGLLAGNILAHLAAALPPMPTGFWDRAPKATPGRLRRVLSRAVFPSLEEFDPELRKKNAASGHLPKGIEAHRRSKAAI